jgi:hypothetical protein
VIFE